MEHVKIKVGPTPWAETSKAWNLGTKEGIEGAWSDFMWFPKSRCIFDPKGFLTMPKQLYDKIFLKEYKPKILNSQ